ncbi:MAG: MFS transporter [Candidatus Moranbacteria bacterium]|nr:MFS transporter [Candidatus Moranbacteria bacterium]
MAAGLLGPLYAIFVQRFVDGVMAVSISWSAFLVATTIFTYFISRYGDGVKEKEYLLLAGYIVRTVAWLLFLLVNNLFLLILVQVILGLGESLGTPAFNSIFAQHLDKNKYVKEYSYWSLISNIVTAIGVMGGGLIITTLGFKTLFITMAFLSLISFLGILPKSRKLL